MIVDFSGKVLAVPNNLAVHFHQEESMVPYSESYSPVIMSHVTESQSPHLLKRNNNTVFLSLHPLNLPSKLLETSKALVQNPSLRITSTFAKIAGIQPLASCPEYFYQPPAGLADSTPAPLQTRLTSQSEGSHTFQLIR